MIARRTQSANAHYSPRARALFTAALLLTGPVISAQETEKSPVIRVRDAHATRFFKPDPARVQAMVRAGMRSLTDQKTTGAAWKQYVSPKDIIGIKVNAASGSFSGTRPPVTAGVVEGLLAAGIPANQIVIWDRHLADLMRAGYGNIAKKYNVRLAGAHEAGYDAWNPYSISSFRGKLRVGDRLFGKEKFSGDSHLSRLITQELTAIICIHTPLYLPRQGAAGHLKPLAMATVDNAARFEFSPVHYRDAVVAICDRLAYSHSAKVKPLLKTARSGSGLALFPLGDGDRFFYFAPHSKEAILPAEAFRLALDLAAKEKQKQEVRILTKGLVWSQWVLPEGRTVLNMDAWQDAMVAHSKLRVHVTDALLCQYHHGQESRPDYAAAVNELWFSPDPLALDVLAYELVEKLRASANLPKGANPAVLHRAAFQNLLGNMYPEDFAVRTLTLPRDAPRGTRE